MKKLKYIGALLVVIALAGCAHSHSHSEEEHAHDENLQLTAYSESMEVYAEAKPFVAGQESSILAHFSYLDNFKPVEDGSIKVSLTVGNKTVSQTLDKPTRTGIYSFSLKPEIEGTGKLQFTIKTSKGNTVIIVPNTKVYTDVHDAQHDAAKAVAQSSNGVTFTKEQSWKVDFATDPCRKEPFGQVVKTMAQIMPTQGDERIVTAKTGGIISFPNIEIVDGKSVNAGQTLFYIESGEMADNNMNVRYKVENPLKVAPLIQSNLTPVKFFHSFILFILVFFVFFLSVMPGSTLNFVYKYNDSFLLLHLRSDSPKSSIRIA